MNTVALLPPVCALCTRTFVKNRGLQCRCGAIVCRPDERACYALHQAEEHVG